MALPKRRHSKSRGRKRRTYWKLKYPSLTQCPHCKQPILPYRLCPYCGYYKGRQIIEIKKKKEKKKRAR